MPRIWLAIVLCLVVIALTTPYVGAQEGEDDAVYAELAARPVRVPTIDEGGACPHSPTGPIAVERLGSSLGSGPVFLSLGHDGVVQLTSYDKSADGYFTRVIWAVAPDIRSPIVVRGQQINGPNGVRFAYDATMTLDTLRFGSAPGVPLSEDEDNWRFAAASIAVDGPGCYVLQADGPYFSESIVFEVAVS